jgi:transcriptional regulator with XRE-family HTH domain
MEKNKRERLEAQGWKIGSVADFLELTPEESMLIEIKLALSKRLRERRIKQMTQAELAAKIHSSQPRVAKAEQGDPSVSIELLIRAMFAAGITPQEIGEVIASVSSDVLTNEADLPLAQKAEMRVEQGGAILLRS